MGVDTFSSWLEGYASRFRAMNAICGPPSWPTLLASTADVERARAILASPTSGVDDASSAQRLLSAVLHPDTQEPIAIPFRMAAHVPINSILLFGMLSARSVPANCLWQFSNQSFNALQFYANKNASNSVTNEELMASYLGSISSSVLVAGGLSYYLQRSAPTSTLAAGLQMAVPFLGAVAGKPLQIGLMRQDEWSRGVAVFTANGDAAGVSVEAGRVAVLSTIITRSLYLLPMLWMPFLQQRLERLIPRAPSSLLYVLHAAFTSAIVTPACIALFDQRASILVKDAHGGEVKLFFNKGL
jgi:sideroflexin-5